MKSLISINMRLFFFTNMNHFILTKTSLRFCKCNIILLSCKYNIILFNKTNDIIQKKCICKDKSFMFVKNVILRCCIYI